MAPVGFERRRPELRELVAGPPTELFRPPDSSTAPLPDVEYAVSYSLLPGGGQPVFSVFTMASDLLGGDALVRYALMAAAVRRGWPFGTYAKLTEGLAKQVTRCAHHNVVGFLVMPNGGLAMHVSFSPPLPET